MNRRERIEQWVNDSDYTVGVDIKNELRALWKVLAEYEHAIELGDGTTPPALDAYHEGQGESCEHAHVAEMNLQVARQERDVARARLERARAIVEMAIRIDGIASGEEWWCDELAARIDAYHAGQEDGDE